MKCVNCGQDIPDESIFCPYCGEKFERQKHDITTKKKTWWPYFTLVLCILLTISMAIGIIVFYMPLAENNLLLNIKFESTKREIAENEKEIKSLNRKLDESKKTADKYKKQYDEAKAAGSNFDKIASVLGKAKTSNGIISVSSKIYSVKKGESLTVSIKWPSNGATQYMGLTDNSIASASWNNNNNVVIVGKKQGVTELYFGSNESCSENYFSVVVVCY